MAGGSDSRPPPSTSSAAATSVRAGRRRPRPTLNSRSHPATGNRPGGGRQSVRGHRRATQHRPHSTAQDTQHRFPFRLSAKRVRGEDCSYAGDAGFTAWVRHTPDHCLGLQIRCKTVTCSAHACQWRSPHPRSPGQTRAGCPLRLNGLLCRSGTEWRAQSGWRVRVRRRRCSRTCRAPAV